jgi:hypothetical protein
MDTFTKDLSGILGRLRGKTQQLCRESARTLYNEMSSGGRYSPGTPIADPSLWKEPRPHVGGFARGSWAASLAGIPDAGPGNIGAADVQVLGVIEELQVGQTLTVANRAPYIRRLEYDGHSTQAREGFVRPAVEAWGQIVDEVAVRLAAA